MTRSPPITAHLHDEDPGAAARHRRRPAQRPHRRLLAQPVLGVRPRHAAGVNIVMMWQQSGVNIVMMWQQSGVNIVMMW